jgi:pectate lyase
LYCLFNNYYSEAGDTYRVGVGQNAIFLSENNYFDGVNVPLYMTPNGETGGQILSKGDVFHNTTGNTTGTKTGFTPPYPYTLDPTANVPALVQAGCGCHDVVVLPQVEHPPARPQLFPTSRDY